MLCHKSLDWYTELFKHIRVKHTVPDVQKNLISFLSKSDKYISGDQETRLYLTELMLVLLTCKKEIIAHHFFTGNMKITQ